MAVDDVASDLVGPTEPLERHSSKPRLWTTAIVRPTIRGTEGGGKQRSAPHRSVGLVSLHCSVRHDGRRVRRRFHERMGSVEYGLATETMLLSWVVWLKAAASGVYQMLDGTVLENAGHPRLPEQPEALHVTSETPTSSRWDTTLDIDFRNGDYRFHDLTGWSEPEWTVGNKFTIDLGRLPRRDRDIVRISASPFLFQHFDVTCNGIPAGSFAANQPFIASFPVPPSARRTDGALLLTIDVSDPKRPSDYIDTPDDRQLGLSIARIEVLGTTSDDNTAWPALPPLSSLSNDAAVLDLFESLGDNCELGFIQKRAGVRGSSLLRFCATPVGSLLKGLAHGFAGVDSSGGLEIVVDGPAEAREYQVRLSRYGLHYHTLTFTHQISEVDVRDRELAKLRHKHAKFLDGLARRDRVYVLKQNYHMPIATVWTVWLALQRFGANTLLWVRKAAPGELSGQVRVLGPGLIEGTVANFADYTDATQGDDAAWVSLCRDVLQLIVQNTSESHDHQDDDHPDDQAGEA